jgi:hypothetical protein
METILAIVLFVIMIYLIYDEFGGKVGTLETRRRLADYYAPGSVFEPVNQGLARGVRLMELHIYSDEQDHPMVSMKPLNSGYEESASLESCLIDITNDAFPSKDPFILSLVFHTDKSITMNRVAELLKTIPRKHLTDLQNVSELSLDALANKLILVSGGCEGTELEPLINLSWNTSELRRLTYQQALNPRDPEELRKYNRDRITLVAPEYELKTINQNPDRPRLLGCQWNLMDTEGSGFSLMR